MFGMNFSVAALFVISPLTFAAQQFMAAQLPAIPDLTWVGQVRDAGLVGALLIAVYALWRSWEQMLVKIDQVIEKKDAQILEKDKQILQMIEHVTAGQITQVETNRELRKIIEESVRTKSELKVSIDAMCKGLANLPCTAGEFAKAR